MTTCKEQHHLCKAICCRSEGFGYEKGVLTEEQKKYYKMHKGTVILERPHIDIVLIYIPCKNLDKNYNCKIYKDRPKVCKEGYNQLKKGVIFSPHCIYTPNKDSIVMTEKEVEELIK